MYKSRKRRSASMQLKVQWADGIPESEKNAVQRQCRSQEQSVGRNRNQLQHVYRPLSGRCDQEADELRPRHGAGASRRDGRSCRCASGPNLCARLREQGEVIMSCWIMARQAARCRNRQRYGTHRSREAARPADRFIRIRRCRSNTRIGAPPTGAPPDASSSPLPTDDEKQHGMKTLPNSEMPFGNAERPERGFGSNVRSCQRDQSRRRCNPFREHEAARPNNRVN